jgi:type I restriction-modification system DNA methylase subunit
MVAVPNTACELLKTAYTVLDLDKGELLSADFSPTENTTLEQWVNKGDWLSLAKQVGAEKVFFVKDDPVIIFASSQVQDKAALKKVFNDVWCMARPQRLFLASDGELAVYDLTRPPIRPDQDWGENQPLAVVRHISEVARELKNYRREKIESGKLFEEERFGNEDQRADQSLIRDLKTVRAKLTSPNSDNALERKYAHSLIGRSIFIRYLEDRGVLTRDYFENIANKHKKPEWKSILDTPLSKPDFNSVDTEKRLYTKILENKEFTYALFDKLSEDFNGDMFPSDFNERKSVRTNHLKLLKSFLMGDVENQQKVFFWAYKFDIIPIELISSIYEEFYLTENSDTGNHGTHYTPSSLVRFVLSQVLTPKCLEKNPRILDPCCGSGIFLVEAFRRIVRYRFYKQGKTPNSKELKKIIRDQLAGIEINEEAIRVAAFSLYLALLHFQEPPAIWEQIKKGERLPGLKYQEISSGSGEKFNNLIEANAFDVAEKINDVSVLNKFNSNCADIVIGNPPWGQPKKGDIPGTEALSIAVDWCSQRNYPVGDKERSQAFIWRILDFLRNEGTASILISTGVFFKHHENSQKFRRKWLSSVNLIEVVNFSHVRNIFFSGAISPFASVVFQKKTDVELSHQVVNYFSAKKSAQAVRLKSVILSYVDLQRIQQIDLLNNDKLWKIYWWGNHRDLSLIRVLELNPALNELCDLDNTGRGFEEREGSGLSGTLQQYKELPSRGLKRYGTLDKTRLKSVPVRVGRMGKSEGLYSGMRILVKRGITQKSSPKGQIISRLESEKFCFRHSIYCVKLTESDDWKYKIVLAILWSSLARYYFFLTTSTWGAWHHEIHHEELLKLPVRLPESQKEIDDLISIVDQLRSLIFSSKGASSSNHEIQLEMDINLPHLRNDSDEILHLENRLNDLVFNLYRLRESERDLIRDMCDMGIDLFYNDIESAAAKKIPTKNLKQKFGLLQTLSSLNDYDFPDELKDYLILFLNSWNHELCPEGEFSWQIIVSDQSETMLCLIFSTQEIGYLPQPSNNDEDAWAAVLKELNDALLSPYDSSNIYIDGIVRTVTDTDIIIIKRNEKRLWTKSMAREDIEATLLQAMNLQEFKQGLSA